MRDKSFKQRKYYWKKKGMTEEQAIELASGKKTTSKFKVVQLYPTNSIIPIFSSSNILNKKKISLAIKPNKKLQNILSQVAMIALVCILSFILIQASVVVFGTNFLGYLKAGCLEIGIMLLVMTTVKSKTERFLKYFILFCAIFLSFFILHSGATIGAATSHKKISQENIELTNLTETRSKLIANHDTLPVNHTTKRNALMTEVKELDTKISAVLSLSKSSPAMTALNAATNTEIWSRAVFLLMNLFFGHLLAQKLRSGRECLT